MAAAGCCINRQSADCVADCYDACDRCRAGHLGDRAGSGQASIVVEQVAGHRVAGDACFCAVGQAGFLDGCCIIDSADRAGHVDGQRRGGSTSVGVGQRVGKHRVLYLNADAVEAVVSAATGEGDVLEGGRGGDAAGGDVCGVAGYCAGCNVGPRAAVGVPGCGFSGGKVSEGHRRGVIQLV